MIDIYDNEFDDCRNWIKAKRIKNVPWESIRYACKGDLNGLIGFIRQSIDDYDWSEELNENTWMRIVDALKEAEERRIELSKTATIPVNQGEMNGVRVPNDPHSSWQLYRKHLLNKGFSTDAVDDIEISAIRILQQLSKDTVSTGPVKGLVVGNVQSGKTANMSGLMAMAADWGWNMFIILSGTIENLRRQTQNRLFEDLNHGGNLSWTQFDHLSKKKTLPGQRLSDLQLTSGNARYMTVCLKVKSRLTDLIEWIEADKNNIQNLKILVIDDEADQAGINTGDVYSADDKKMINRLILNLVHCRDKDATSDANNTYQSHYKAMNYISYTATPYANCLNEQGENSLYPKSFIHTLGVPFSYFGPQIIFGSQDADREQVLEIVNEVTDSDVKAIKRIHAGDKTDIPGTMKDAIQWFLCCVSVMRYYNYKKPVSMLIHTSQKQTHHTFIADAVQKWIIDNRENMISLCRDTYMRQTRKLSKAGFRKAYPDYEYDNAFIWDYPEFECIAGEIEELLRFVSPILMDDEGELKYNKGIHLCIDNCSNNGISEDGMHMRLAYPDERSSDIPDYATAFIVIGGNTLSRGLTLEGLVSTFFLRSVKQVDTLMQMGRWFGYRPHYELLPRIWMTEDTSNKFTYLADVDFDLRDQIYQMMLAGMNPLDFGLTLMTSPKAGWMSLTSKKKMQMAEAAGVDFSGMDTQLTVYTRNVSDLRNNIDVADKFISRLGKYRESTNTMAYIWENIDFHTIKTGFFDRGFKVPVTSKAFQQIDLLTEWIEDQSGKGYMGKWNVMLCGVTPFTENSDKNWKLSNGITIGKVNRSCKTDSGDHFNIGVLSGKKDYVADITEEMFDDPGDWEKMRKCRNMSAQYKTFRSLAGVDKIPLFIIYNIDKNSRPLNDSERTALNVDEDLIGIAMVIPGIRGRHNTVTRLKIRHMETDQEAGE